MTVSELSDYITRRKKILKSQYLNEVQNGCTRSRIRIERSNFGNSKGSKKIFLHMSVLNVVCCLPLHAHHQDVLMEANMQFVHTTTDLQKFNS